MKISSHFHKFVILLLVGFALGMIAGHWWTLKTAKSYWKHGGMRHHMMNKLSKELHLNADQEAAVEAIFEAKRTKMMALKEEVRPQFQEIRRSAQDEIRKHLNADQLETFNALVVKMEERRNKRFQKRMAQS